MRRIVLFTLVLLASTPACAERHAAARIDSALDVVARAVDPAYEFAIDACVTRQTLVADAVEKKEISVPTGDAQIAEIRARCERVRQAFELIRRSHSEARTLLSEENITEAQRRLDAIAEAWRSLKGGTE